MGGFGGLFTGIAGGVAGGVGGSMSLSDKWAAESDKAEELRLDALGKDREAADAIGRGRKEAGVKRMQATQLIAKQRQAYIASGVDPTVGTAANVMADTRLMTAHDARTAEDNAYREAFGHKKEAANLRRDQKKLDERNADHGRKAVEVVSSILGSAGSYSG